jgi:hypothetical protein
MLVVVAGGFYGASRARRTRLCRFPDRVVRSVPTDRHQPRDVHPAGKDAPLEPASPTVRIGTVAEFHSWLLDAFRSKSSRQRLDAVFEMGQTLGAEDFDHAMHVAGQLPVEWVRSVLISGIFYSQGRARGSRAVEDVKLQSYRGFDEAFATGGAWAGWANAEPRAALAAVKETNDRGVRGLVYAAWGLEDLDTMLIEEDAMPAGQQHFMEWAKADPERAVDFAWTLDESLRGTVLERIAHGWASNWSGKYRADFMSYLMLVVGGDSEDYLSRTLTAWWAEYDPRQAVEYAANLEPKSRDRAERFLGALSVWLQAEPDAGIEWLKAYATQHDDGPAAVALALRPLMEMGNPDGAARIIDSIPELAGDRALCRSLFKNWVELDPPAALDWITGKETDREVLLEFAGTAGLNLARWNIEAARDWARQLSDAGRQANALSGIAFVEAYSDPRPSTDWMLALPMGRGRDRCVAAYVTGALEHAKGATEPNDYILRQATGNLVDLAKSVQDSALGNDEKQRLLGLIYGWPSAP